MTTYPTTHRMSIAVSDNDFITEQADGTVFFTSTGRYYQLLSCTGDIRQMIYEHKQNGYHPNCSICQDKARKEETGVTLEAMQLRSNVISNALKTDDLGSEERESLWRELAEIAVWIEREYAYLSDIGDAKICARFGTQL